MADRLRDINSVTMQVPKEYCYSNMESLLRENVVVPLVLKPCNKLFILVLMDYVVFLISSSHR